MAVSVRNLIVAAIFVLLAAAEARRLEEDKAAGLVECWGALVEIKSCSGELFQYFVSGRRVDSISDDCCRAVRTITHNCWPTMFDSVGFTAQQAHLLRGYCDAALADGGLAAPAPAPVTAQPLVV
ncbi:Egg cell-secreted protein 1.4 [Linum perenne]